MADIYLKAQEVTSQGTLRAPKARATQGGLGALGIFLGGGGGKGGGGKRGLLWDFGK